MKLTLRLLKVNNQRCCVLTKYLKLPTVKLVKVVLVSVLYLDLHPDSGKKKGIEKIAGGSYICHLYKLIYNLNVISSVFTSFSNINMNIHECYFIES